MPQPVEARVPEWLRRWSQEGREALASGEKPRSPEEYAAEAGASLPEAPPPEHLPKGVRRMERQDGSVKYEVKHRGHYVGTAADVEEARRMKQEAESS